MEIVGDIPFYHGSCACNVAAAIGPYGADGSMLPIRTCERIVTALRSLFPAV